MTSETHTLKSDVIDQAVIYSRLNGQNSPLDVLIDSKVLHEILNLEIEFSQWINSIIKEYSYVHGEDYFFKKDHFIYITLDMAKEICLLNKSKVGMSLRRTLISLISPVN